MILYIYIYIYIYINIYIYKYTYIYVCIYIWYSPMKAPFWSQFPYSFLRIGSTPQRIKATLTALE